MPLLETLALSLGPSIAKAIVKTWLGQGWKTDLAGSLVDLAKGALTCWRLLWMRITFWTRSRLLPLVVNMVRRGWRPAPPHAHRCLTLRL